MTLMLFCCFCGARLRGGSSSTRVCGGCGARFAMAMDQDGCVIGLRVMDCGTPECCRLRKGD